MIDLDLDLVGEVAERGPQVGGHVVVAPRRAACARRPRCSTQSGITLVFIRARRRSCWARTWCACRRGGARGAPACGRRVEARRRSRAGSSSACLVSSSRPERVDPLAVHSSWKRGAGRYSASRCTTAAAFTSALSARNGIEPWPGRAAHPQPAPGDALLADVDRDVRRLGRTAVQAAALGQHVVGADRVGLVVGHPLQRRGRCPTPRRRRRSRSGRPSGGSR